VLISEGDVTHFATAHFRETRERKGYWTSVYDRGCRIER
jgi:hypothetical protein